VLRQLARLTQSLPAAGPNALAVAVYAGPDGETVPAREAGVEGVACVDDAARVLEVLCDVWAATGLPWVERWARGLLDFVLYMQDADGRWLNFVYDWDGTRNREGRTSITGENFWHARALLGVSHAWLTFGDERAERALRLGLDHAVAKTAPSDVRALHVQVAHRLIRDVDDVALLPTIRGWADEIASCRLDGHLMNSPDERGTPHLWGHIQEGVLACAGELLEDDDLVSTASRSAERVLAPVVRDGFALRSVTPYDVSSSIFSLDRLADTDPTGPWGALATDARDWFHGRNPAGAPVYDTAAGRVADGIDGGRISGNSGAEANAEAAAALLDRAIAVAIAMPVDTIPV
jgi:hypothetical protein